MNFWLIIILLALLFTEFRFGIIGLLNSLDVFTFLVIFVLIYYYYYK